jgi:hypothetical protein
MVALLLRDAIVAPQPMPQKRVAPCMAR